MRWAQLNEEQQFEWYIADCRQRDDIDLSHIPFEEYVEIENSRFCEVPEDNG